jgi:putative heme-binding domain-containing protein
VHRKTVEPKGVGYVANRADKGKEFVSSNDTWFRPAQFANAPDGNLYIIDVYREVIEHPLSLPPEIKQHLDLTSGRDRGRIYRVVANGHQQRPLPHLQQVSTTALVAQLESANGWNRDTAMRLLYERQDRAAIEPLTKLAAQGKLPQTRAQALMALAGLKALTPDVLLARLDDEHSRVREAAVRLSEGLARTSPALRDRICQLAADPEMRVRYQVAFSLGEFDDAGCSVALGRILRHDAADPWMRLAVFSSLADGAGDVFASLASDKDWRATDEGRKLLYELARYIGRQHKQPEVARLLVALESLPQNETTLAAAVMRGLGEGLARGPGSFKSQLAALGSPKAEAMLTRMLSAAQATAADEARPAGDRIEAIRLLALGSFADGGAVLIRLLSTRESQDVQSAALGTLAKYPDPQIAEALLAAWPTMSPRLKAEATEALFSRGEWLTVLVAAAEQGTFSLADLDPARLKTLEAHPNAALHKRAAPLLAKVKIGKRQDVVESYRSVLSAAGDASRGQQMFQKICATCHRLDGFGHEIGPNLASFRNRGAEAILVNVLDPNREVNPQFVNYVVTTDDGRAVTGMIASETANSVTLRRAENATDTVERSQIEELRSTGLSIMPEGLEKQIDPGKMADLLAYLLRAL